MTNAINHALTHFSHTTTPTPFILHTLPPPSQAKPGPSTSTPSTLHHPPAPTTGTAAVPSVPVKKLPSSALPKLVSILEIIKRNYVPVPVVDAGAADEIPVVEEGRKADANAKAKGKGKGKKVRLEGLHQYTRLGALEELGLSVVEVLGDDEDEGAQEKEQERMDAIALKWVKGKGASKRPRMKHTPFMVVVLSTCVIPELMDSPAFTYQPPERITKKKESAGLNSTEAGTEVVAGEGEEGEAMITDKEGEGEPAKKKRKRRNSKKKKHASEAGGAKDVEKAPESVMKGMDVDLIPVST